MTTTKPGYRTTEHALAWAVVVLGAFALFRCPGAIEHLAALLGPALASAAYSLSRGRAKTTAPFVLTTESATSLRDQLSRAFRGRLAS